MYSWNIIEWTLLLIQQKYLILKKFLALSSYVIVKGQNFLEEYCDPWRSGRYVSLETSESDDALTQRHVPEERNLRSHRCENLRTRPVSLYLVWPCNLPFRCILNPKIFGCETLKSGLLFHDSVYIRSFIWFAADGGGTFLRTVGTNLPNNPTKTVMTLLRFLAAVVSLNDQ